MLGARIKMRSGTYATSPQGNNVSMKVGTGQELRAPVRGRGLLRSSHEAWKHKEGRGFGVPRPSLWSAFPFASGAYESPLILLSSSSKILQESVSLSCTRRRFAYEPRVGLSV